jgi:uncharacterized membrane protein
MSALQNAGSTSIASCFSDAVFAIAMTVLTVSLALPADTTNAEVGNAA